MSWPSHNFQVGDIVKLRSASSLQEVKQVREHVINTQYLSSFHSQKRRAAADFELVERPTPKKEKPMTQKLYKTKDGTYGTLLTKDSKGHFVLEMKGGGAVASYDPANLEEVLPYTVQIQWAQGPTKHYESTQDALEVDDIVFGEGLNLGRVDKIDTKNSNALPAPKMRKVGTVAV